MANEKENTSLEINEEHKTQEGVHTLAHDIEKAKASSGMNARASASSEPFRSLASDLAHALGEKRGTVVRLAIAEEEKQKMLAEGEKVFSRQNLFFIIASALLVIVGIILIVFLYIKKNTGDVIVQQSVVLPTYLLTDTNLTVDLFSNEGSSFELFQNVFSATDTGLIVGVYPFRGDSRTGTLISFKEFLETTGLVVPENVLSVVSPYYMVGYSDTGIQRSPFLVIKGGSYEAMNNALRGWEETLYSDMQKVFPRSSNVTEISFSNAIISNKDARVVRKDDGTIDFFYAFIDQTTVLFGFDTDLVSIAISRLNTEQLRK